MLMLILIYCCVMCFAGGWLFCSIRRDRQESQDFWLRVEEKEKETELLTAARAQYRADIHALLILTGEGLHPGKGKQVAATISEICDRYGMDENAYLHRRKV